MQNKLGVEITKAVIGFAIAMGQDVKAVLEDGKVSALEAFSLVPEVIGLIESVIEDRHALRDELLDLTVDEVAELHEYVTLRFDIAEDDVELVIEDSIRMALSILQFITAHFIKDDDIANDPEVVLL